MGLPRVGVTFIERERLQTRGALVLFRNTMNDYLRQIYASAAVYDEFLLAMTQTQVDWRAWMASAYLARQVDGHSVCPQDTRTTFRVTPVLVAAHPL